MGDKMKNAVFVMLAILAMAGAFILGMYYPSQRVAPAAVSDNDAVRSLNLQKTCAEGAAAYYKTENLQPKSGEIDSYWNHYDSKRGKCFILTRVNDLSGGTEGHNRSTYEVLNDAFDGTSYGSIYISHPTIDPKDDVASMCAMLSDGVHSTQCHSQAEWTDYVATFGILTN